MNNAFKFTSFFDKVDKFLEVNCKVRTCVELVTFEKACNLFTVEICLPASQRYIETSTFIFYLG